MNKIVYLVILFIISFGYLNRIPYVNFPPDLILVITWFWGLVGLAFFMDQRNNILNIISNRIYVYYFFAIMLVATLYPYYLYNQSIISTILSQRFNYSILFLLVFLWIKPSENDFYKAIQLCTYIGIVGMLISIVFPSYFISAENYNNLLGRQSAGSADLITSSTGSSLLLFYFFMQIEKWFYKPNTKQVVEVLFLLLMLILLQNRSRLIISIPIFIYSFIRLKSVNKRKYWMIIGIVFSLVFSFLFNSIYSLYEETQAQLGDNDYNRWQAISYFLFEAKCNIFTILFGHGLSASGSDYLKVLLTAQEDRYAYLSDIGLIGTFYLYGLSFVSIVYYFVIKSFKSFQPMYLKFFALYIIVVPTIQAFGHTSKDAILYSMFFYLVIYNQKLRVLFLRRKLLLKRK